VRRRPAWPEIEDLHRDVKALGLIILEEGEASGVTSRSSPSTKSSES